MAWVMGSGFATGQEILQFFAGFGYWGYAGIVINIFGFAAVGLTLVRTGFLNRNDENFDQLEYYCGKRLGKFYSWLIPVMLIPTLSVLISGAGATLSEYCGINHHVGAALMASMVLVSYLLGFQRFVRIVSMISPLIIMFILIVGITVVCRDFGAVSYVPSYAEELATVKNSPSWAISAVLYISLTFIGGSNYYTALGTTGTDEKELRIGVLAGAGAVIAAISVIVTAMLCNAGSIVQLDIPNLYLAGRAAPALSGIFSVMLILGIFSACSAMMWTVCSKFTTEGTRNSRIFAVYITAAVFVMGMFSFSGLISILYPFIGYVGLVYMVCVVMKGWEQHKEISAAKKECLQSQQEEQQQ